MRYFRPVGLKKFEIHCSRPQTWNRNAVTYQKSPDSITVSHPHILFFIIHFNVILPSTLSFLSGVFRQWFPITHMCYMSNPSHPS